VVGLVDLDLVVGLKWVTRYGYGGGLAIWLWGYGYGDEFVGRMVGGF